MMFGVGIFTLVWVLMRADDFRFRGTIFMAALLFASSILGLLNKRWSNLFAAILSGYLPIECLWEFWMFPRNAEVPTFSLEHFKYFFGNVGREDGTLMFVVVTLMLLTRSAFATIRTAKEVKSPLPGVKLSESIGTSGLSRRFQLCDWRG